MNIVVDASAWFAYFNGTNAGAVVKEYLESADEVITPASVVAEITQAARERHGNSQEFLHFVESKSRIEPITADIARRAGKLLATEPGRRLRVRDAFVLATAQATHARILSDNRSLEGLEDIVPLG